MSVAGVGMVADAVALVAVQTVKVPPGAAEGSEVALMATEKYGNRTDSGAGLRANALHSSTGWVRSSPGAPSTSSLCALDGP
eukprot:1053811-Prymnesium_polylepis.1